MSDSDNPAIEILSQFDGDLSAVRIRLLVAFARDGYSFTTAAIAEAFGTSGRTASRYCREASESDGVVFSRTVGGVVDGTNKKVLRSAAGATIGTAADDTKYDSSWERFCREA